MAKKVTTKTTEQTIEADHAPEFQEIPDMPLVQESTIAESELFDALESFGSDVSLIKVNKIVNGRRQWCGNVEPSVLRDEGEAFIAREWGGGRYYLIGFVNGKYLQGNCRTVEIYEIPESKKTVLQSQIPLQNSEVMILREEIARQHEMVLRLLESQKVSAPSGPTLPEIISAIGSMRALVPAPPDLTAVLPGLVGLMKFAKEAVSPDSGGGFADIVSGALKALPMIMGGIANMRKDASSGAAENSAINAEQTEKELLAQAVATLKAEAANGTDPDSVVYWISSHMQQPNYRNMAVILLNRQFETLFQVDHDLEKEPLRSWFLKVYTELRKVFVDDNADKIPDITAGGVGGEADAK